jgi:GNAT superfamily N-acetyltransferase
MPLEIRPFQDSDFGEAVRLSNLVEPDYPTTEEEWRHWDAERHPKIRHGRFVAHLEGVLAGVGQFSQSNENYDPRKFDLEVSVHPELRRRGIGAALFEQVVQTIEPFEPIQLLMGVREDRADAIRFVTSRGFTENMREWESRLDTRTVDGELLVGCRERLREHGLEIRTLAELQASDPEWGRKLHALKTAIDRDIPSVDPATETDFDHWLQAMQKNPNLIPEARFFAVDGDRLVGESSLFRPLAGQYLDTGVTGVLPEYRRRGIALALKLCAIQYAREQGVAEIRTWNATTNQAMLSINVALGFVRQPAWIFFTKQLS